MAGKLLNTLPCNLTLLTRCSRVSLCRASQAEAGRQEALALLWELVVLGHRTRLHPP